MRELRTDLGNRERRGIGCEYRGLGNILLDVGKDLLFHPHLLENGLDHPVGVGEIGSIRGSGQQGFQPIGLVARDLALREERGYLPVNIGDTFIDSGLVEVGDHDGHPKPA